MPERGRDCIKQTYLSLSAIHCFHANADGTAVGVQTLDRSELHDCRGYIAKTFSCKIGASKMFYKRTKVDARILLCVAIGCYKLEVSAGN